MLAKVLLGVGSLGGLAGIGWLARETKMSDELLQTAAATHVLCVGGLAQTVFAVSYGYGASLFSVGVFQLLKHKAKILAGSLSHSAIAHAANYALYGSRLFAFIWRRNGAASFEKNRAVTKERMAKMGIATKVAAWSGVAWLMALYAVPLAFNVKQHPVYKTLDVLIPKQLHWLEWAGHATAFLGLGIQCMADEQKSRAKASKPDAPCMSGLWTLCRHPNYLGEILFHAGVFAGGACSYGTDWKKWALAAVAPLFMIRVILGATRNLEQKQQEKYGSDPLYAHYRKSVPCLYPGGWMKGGCPVQKTA